MSMDISILTSSRWLHPLFLCLWAHRSHPEPFKRPKRVSAKVEA